jgi:hypothetical protein
MMQINNDGIGRRTDFTERGIYRIIVVNTTLLWSDNERTGNFEASEKKKRGRKKKKKNSRISKSSLIPMLASNGND